MIEPKLEVPAELRELAEKTIDQAEKAFGMFFDAASKSMTSVPGAGSDISKQALTFTEQNMKAAFEHARKLVQATDLQEAMRIQSEFLRSQFTSAGEHMRQITGTVHVVGKGCRQRQVLEQQNFQEGIGSASVVAGIGDHRPGRVRRREVADCGIAQEFVERRLDLLLDEIRDRGRSTPYAGRRYRRCRCRRLLPLTAAAAHRDRS